MSYLGKVALKASDIRRLDVTSSTSATHTLSWTPPNEQSLIITINGVKQQNNYSISGVTLTLDSALTATDEMEVIGINDIGTTNVPGSGVITNDMVSPSAAIAQSKLATLAIDTAELADDAVTADKLANSINTEIAANTAKVTNATHTGDVTGATALTIADNAVNLAKLEDGTQGDILYYGASGAPTRLGFGTSGDFLKTQGTGANPTWATLPSSGTAGEPNFQIYNTVGVHWSSSAYVKVAWNNIIWETDTGSCDVTTNHRFTVPTGKGGKYAIQTHVKAPSGGNGYMKILVSGVELNNPWLSWTTDYGGSKIIYTINILDLDAADYLEWWCYSSGNGTAGGGMYASGWRFAE